MHEAAWTCRIRTPRSGSQRTDSEWEHTLDTMGRSLLVTLAVSL